jgi:hypothetical protein
MTRPITDTLRHIGGGVFIDTASDKLTELVNAVDETGKPGKLLLEVSVKKASRGGAMHITGKVTVKNHPKKRWKRSCSRHPRATSSPTIRANANWTSRVCRMSSALPLNLKPHNEK